MRDYSPVRFLLSVALCIGLLVPAFATAAPTKSPSGDPPARSSASHKLDPVLARLQDEATEKGRLSAEKFGKKRGLRTDGTWVSVVIEGIAGKSGSAIRAIEEHGGKVGASYGALSSARVPVVKLKTLAKSSSVLRVRQPRRIVAEVMSEGVAETNASALHSDTTQGTGVKVGIIDIGFHGLNAKLGGELPSIVTKWGGSALGPEGNSTDPDGYPIDTHGTAVAEVVHDMAPGASLYVAQITSEVEIGAAKNWMVSQGVKVINMSLGLPGAGPCDGTGDINGIIDSAVSQGVFWANSAGNHREKHWSGDFVDQGGVAGLHEFGDGSEFRQQFYALAYENVGASLTWQDSWTNASQDYDLELWYNGGSGWELYASSEATQNGAPGCDPYEQLSGYVLDTGTYAWCIRRYDAASADVDFDLFDWYGDLPEKTDARSIVIPADNASEGFVAVAALGRAPSYAQETYSSEGPTRDGRVVPEIAGPSAVANSVYGGFAGTSASSPHVAGAAALVRQTYPAFTPAQVETFLETHAVDIAEDGPDTATGAGRLWLPSLTSLEKATTLALAATPTTTSYEKPTTLKATLLDSAGKGVGGRAVTFWRSYDSVNWTSIGTVTSSAGTGVATKSYTPTRRAYVKATFARVKGAWKASTSGTVGINRYAYLTTPSSASRVRKNVAFSVSGYLRPKHPAGSYAVKIRCERYESGSWVLKKITSVKVADYNSTTSKYSGKIVLPSVGKWRLRAYVPGDSQHATTYSGSRYVLVNPTYFSISASRSTVTSTISSKLTGTLKNMSGTALAGRTVYLQRSTNGTTWSNLKKLTTSSLGRVSVSVRPSTKTYYRFRYGGSSSYMGSYSAKKSITPQ